MSVVTLIPGDGIGPEITQSIKDIFAAAGADVQWDEQLAGQVALDKYGELIPQTLVESLKQHKVGLKGPISTPIGKGFKSINVSLRQMFNLYANIRPGKSIKGVETPFTDVDVVIFRENTEGLYSGLEIWDEKNQIADALNRISYKGSERLLRAAFEYARKHGRKKVTIVHKANILKLSSGLFLKVGLEVAKEYPDIECEERIVDNMCMQLVRNPGMYDILASTNLFGDILSDLVAGLVGGLGVTPGANIGDDLAIFEAVHGSAPDIAGQNKANPTAMLKSALMMLHHLGQGNVADRIEKALHDTLAIKEECTGDMGGRCSTTTFTQNVINKL
ncbi:MAG: NAD-dependent isocitrate dehydrogenase [Bacteroidia bacterium]|nr:NAD-dependent isocitrate dehydrogenase [Bacteroidia bacterium]